MPAAVNVLRTVLDFYEHAVKNRDFGAAAQLLAPVYIQHRNDVADGAAGHQRPGSNCPALPRV